MPVVSVIIPAYNHADYLPVTLESVFAQTFQDYEIIVVNDGSPDNTAAVLQPWIETGRIRYIEQANSGQAAARNRGIAMAAGEFIALLDDDDTWPVDKLEWQVDVLRTVPDVDLVGGSETRDMCLIQRTSETQQRLLVAGIDVFWGCPFTSPGQTLIRTAALRAIGGFDIATRGADDFDVYVRLARSKPLMLVRRLALQYREHPLNASKDRWEMLDAAAGCLRRRLPEVRFGQRWAAYRRAYRGLYAYVGRELVLGFRGWPAVWDGVRSGGIVRLARAFWLGLMIDPKLVRSVLRDYFLGRSHNVPSDRPNSSLAT